MLPPNSLRSYGGRGVEPLKYGLDEVPLERLYSNSEPWKALPPEAETTMICVGSLNSAAAPVEMTLNCERASSEGISGSPRCSVISLLMTPSKMMPRPP